jgi:hypothetical protein
MSDANEFIVRVELHGAGAGDYAALHIEMKKWGLDRIIRFPPRHTPETLPEGEYFIAIQSNSQAILDLAEAAAKAAYGGKHAILVTAAVKDGILTRGLDPAAP